MAILDSPLQALRSTRPRVTVLTDRCAGCQECVVRCPAAALSMDERRWVAVADDDLCVGCRQCVRTCPFSAITVEGPVLVAPRAPTRLAEADLGGAPRQGAVSGAGGGAGTNLGGGTVDLLEETRLGFATLAEALQEAERCLLCPDPTCVRGCPTHNDIPSFIRAIRERDFAGAHDVLRRTTVLPDVCSRVCNQAAQCEGACSWSLAGAEPVSIGRLERFITEQVPVPPPVAGSTPESGELSVAVVGSGPAGIGAAWELLEGGAEVTVYEKDPTPGGLCDWGIPDFTLPEQIARRPWDQLVEAGVTLSCGTEITPGDLTRLLLEHDAVVLANGAGVPLAPPIPGASLPGVTDATTWLKATKQAIESGGGLAELLHAIGDSPSLSGEGAAPARVLVLGAGNTAMDVARMARRLGLSPLCVDWVDERFALARPDELEEARSEGVEIRFLRTVTAIDGDGKVERAMLAETEQHRADRRPRVLPDQPQAVAVDLVVMAMGYRLDPRFAEQLADTPVPKRVEGVPDREWMASGILAAPASPAAHGYRVGRLSLEREVGTGAASFPMQPRLWVAGDALVGPSTVVEAMTQGRRAARAVLEAAPTRPGHERFDRERRVLVCYESQGGHTARAAEEVAASLMAAGDRAVVRPVSKVSAADLSSADLVVIGSWVEGFVVAGVGPAKTTRRWLEGLPRLPGKRVAIFCTYGVSPKATLPVMRRTLEAKAATVVTQAAFGPREAAGAGPFGTGPFGAAAFAHQLAQRAYPERVPTLLVD